MQLETQQLLNWRDELANAISCPQKLYQQLELEQHLQPQDIEAKRLFGLRVPLPFVSRMEKGNINDPLLLQVMSSRFEFDQADGFVDDPLEEHQSVIPGLLHKYHNRVLLIFRSGCAINCRYCFRRHFPYGDNKGGKKNWQKCIEYVNQNPQIDEVILSGGDPLMASDEEVAWFYQQLKQHTQIKRVRIHSRLPVVIPSRVTPELLATFEQIPTVFVTHINHANEIDNQLARSLWQLKKVCIQLLNQGVLLKDVNDDVETLRQLMTKLVEVGVMPYYLFTPDKVAGTHHFFVSEPDAKALHTQLAAKVSGYMLPKLAKEVPGVPYKQVL